MGKQHQTKGEDQGRPSPHQRPPGADRDGGGGGMQDRLGNARIQEMMKDRGGLKQVEDLVDLTPSQKKWIQALRDLEMLNPNATVADLAMALSLEVWSAGQMWDKDGKSQYPGLILDYKGGDGFKNVRFSDPETGVAVDTGMLKDWAKDKGGSATNVNHAFPAVAAQAGRGWLAAEYGSFMATSGGDTMQNTAETMLGNVKQWNAGEYKGNLRGEGVADDVKEGKTLSQSLLGHFRRENRGR